MVATNNKKKNKELHVFKRLFDKLLTSAAFLQLTVLAIAGPVFTIIIEQLISIITGHPWTPNLQGTQLQILREALWAAHALLGLVLVAMTAGLIRGVKFTLPGGTSAEIDLDDDESESESNQQQSNNQPIANT